MEFNYYKNLNETDNKDELKQKIVDFLAKNPNPKDEDIHKFAEGEGIEPDNFEEIVYSILGSILGFGKSKNFKGEYDPKQVEMGLKVEMEHTNSKMIALRIVKDHLAELPDYYTRLKKAEGEK